jgi:CO/xanthine dehydrogenase Mo-binding subunit
VARRTSRWPARSPGSATTTRCPYRWQTCSPRAILGQGIPPEEDPGLEATARFEPTGAAYSFGTAAALVSVDPDTGDFDVERFVLVHDCGTPARVGEAGTIPPAAAIANALCDALADFSVELDSFPLTPETVWRAMRGE